MLPAAVMDLFWRILAALSFDCFRPSASARSPSRLSSGRDSVDSSSGSLSLGPLSLGADPPHCQSCVSSASRLKRLSCGHLFCDRCCDQIVNLAFEDIEGLAEFPCPVCRSLGGAQGGPGPSRRQPCFSGYFHGPYSLLQETEETEETGWD